MTYLRRFEATASAQQGTQEKETLLLIFYPWLIHNYTKFHLTANYLHRTNENSGTTLWILVSPRCIPTTSESDERVFRGDTPSINLLVVGYWVSLTRGGLPMRFANVHWCGQIQQALKMVYQKGKNNKDTVLLLTLSSISCQIGVHCNYWFLLLLIIYSIYFSHETW